MRPKPRMDLYKAQKKGSKIKRIFVILKDGFLPLIRVTIHIIMRKDILKRKKQ